jgi:predicted acylesterase/phospholipase RssA
LICQNIPEAWKVFEYRILKRKLLPYTFMSQETSTKGAKRQEKAEIIPKQRALVFQGGGSLGAYEAGAYKALYERLYEPNEPLFDVVAGTSIGAINAAIIVSYVKENKTWKGSAERLIEFWNYLSNWDYFSTNPYFSAYLSAFNEWWNYFNKFSNNSVAPGEGARRYYTAKLSEYVGVQTVFLPKIPLMDMRYFDNFIMPNNVWYQYSKHPLENSIKQFTKFPIATSFDENPRQPRLLLTSIDVQAGQTVTFDSYVKEDGSRFTAYGKYLKPEDGRGPVKYPYTIRYDGIELDHVIASASVPINYDYTEIEVEDPESNKRPHYFWDGGLLSNTPLRELVSSHRRYWTKVRGSESVPDLEVYVIDLHSTEQHHVPHDHDGAISRFNDIIYHDRNRQEEKLSNYMADYVELTKKLMDLARTRGATDEDIHKILDAKGQSRTYDKLLKGQFRISNLERIERKADQNNISNKVFDFSASTINQLIKAGYEDAVSHLNRRYRQ